MKNIICNLLLIVCLGIFGCDNSQDSSSKSKNLSKLEISEGSLNPEFKSNQLNYDIDVKYSVDNINIIAKTRQSSDKVNIYVVQESGKNQTNKQTKNISLNEGENLVYIEVLSKNGNLENEYCLKIKRANFDTANNNLSELKVSHGSFSKDFNSEQLYYSMQLINTEQIYFTATAEYKKAAVFINNQEVKNSESSQLIDLTLGDNIIDILVKAVDGSEKKYTVNVNRVSSEHVYEGDFVIKCMSDLRELAGYTAINGSLGISGYEIEENLNDLKFLNYISGDLTIKTLNLISLKGLNNLSSIGGNVIITDNDKLESINFKNLHSVGGDLRIDNNYKLEKLELYKLNTVHSSLILGKINNISNYESLRNLTFIGQDLIIYDNRYLKYSAFEYLQIIGRDLIIESGIFSSKGLAGQHIFFNSLKEVGRDLIVNSCSKVEQISFKNLDVIKRNLKIGYINDLNKITFEKLENIYGECHIHANYSLKDILFPLLIEVGKDLRLETNLDLTSVNFNQLAKIKGQFNFSANKSFVDLKLEALTFANDIMISNNTLLKTVNLYFLSNVENNIQIVGNDSFTNIYLDYLKKLNGFRFHRNNATTYLNLEKLESIEKSLIITENNKLQFIWLGKKLKSINDLLVIQRNNVLDNIKFNNLISIGMGRSHPNRGIDISENNSLKDIKFLSLKNTDGSIDIYKNDNLQKINFTALENADQMKQFGTFYSAIRIYRNNFLTDIDFSNLKRTYGGVYVGYNQKLKNLKLESLSRIGVDDGFLVMGSGLNISHNDLIEEISLDNLEVIGCDVIINENASLKNIKADKLISIGEQCKKEYDNYFKISKNKVLSEISFNKLLTVTNHFFISDNSSLPNQSALTLYDQLTIHSEYMTISGNKE